MIFLAKDFSQYLHFSDDVGITDVCIDELFVVPFVDTILLSNHKLKIIERNLRNTKKNLLFGIPDFSFGLEKP